MVFGVGIGCTDAKKSVVANTYCSIARPFRWSRKDTRETIKRARQQNAEWRDACEKKPVK